MSTVRHFPVGNESGWCAYRLQNKMGEPVIKSDQKLNEQNNNKNLPSKEYKWLEQKDDYFFVPVKKNQDVIITRRLYL